MAITIYPVMPDFAAEIGDVDIAAPLLMSDRAAVTKAFRKYAALIFPQPQDQP